LTLRIFVWTVPRSVSTAFERALIEHPDTSVHHEPFTLPWYFGPDRRSDRYLDRPPRADATWEAAVDRLMNDQAPVVVAKVMAYCATPCLDSIPLERFRHTALIRHPASTVPSLWRGAHDTERTGWSGFDEREVGFDALETALEATGDAVVMDADDLLADPPQMLRAWCEAVGLSCDPTMLTWQPGPVPGWDLWPGWHDAAERSAGLVRRDRRPPPAVDEHLRPVVGRALGPYARLHARRLRVNGS